MGLRTYHAKRDFRKTPEPHGREKPSGRQLSYVIQKHAARRLHYDFRLELGGVLLSWAVPKGPSFDPAQKRLAVHVEDHPLDYGTFEGVIPQGQYGGGTVVLWDRGTWIPEGDAARGLREGKLKFTLEGEKLKGRWTLVRMRGRNNGDKENWLLIKERDEFARSGDITEEQPGSVNENGHGARVWNAKRGSLKGKDALPEFEEPQLATLVEKVPEGEEWIHEIKFDGYRLLIRIDGKTIQVMTRRGQDWTSKFSPLVSAAAALGARRALLDGEAVVMKPDGGSDFQALQNAISGKVRKDIVFYAFDVLHLDGKDLRTLPLIERKKLLKKLLAKAPKSIQFADHMEGKGDAFFREACRAGLEGIVSKRGDQPRRPGRGKDWQKVKCVLRQEFVIGGWTDPEGSRTGFGALLLGFYEGKKLIYAGRVGTGFTQATLKLLMAKLKPLGRKTPAFAHPPAGASGRGVHYVEPRLVGEVGYTGWTSDKILRHPTFLGLREDKVATDAKLESPVSGSTPAAPAEAKGGGRPTANAPIVVSGVRVTHPERVLYPGSAITKRSLAEFYASIADWILPHVAERPLSLVRCPEGMAKECFYQKHATATTAKELKRVKAKADEAPYTYVDDAAGLVALVQMGVLEIHPWGSKVGRLDRPDTLTFDIDPSPELGWGKVRETAVRMRKFLKDLALESWVKTTGGKGLHVVIPLAGKATWDQAKAFTRGVAEGMMRLYPDEYLAKASKEARKGKIFIDWLRNSKGATAVAAYSTRAREGAPVSTPLGWHELPGLSGAGVYTVENLPERLAAGVDPWKEFRTTKQSLTAAMLKKISVRTES
jgi:bifunctional non-homologous end joining protein LigD